MFKRAIVWGTLTLSIFNVQAKANVFCDLFGIGCPKVGQVYFVPGFEQQYIYVTNNSGGRDKYPLNKYYFATQVTTEELVKRYGFHAILFVPFGGSGGPNAATAMERHVVCSNGVDFNAGLLASFYDLNPEEKFPNVADNLIRKEIAVRGCI